MIESRQYRKEMVFALDIGTTKVVALAGKKNDYGRVEIIASSTVESTGVTRGMVFNIDKTVAAIKKATKQIERKCGKQVTEVVVGIAGQHIRSLQHRGVLIRDNSEVEINEADIKKLKDDMHKIVLDPGAKIIHVIPQDYKVDNEEGITDPKGYNGVRLEANFHIITGQYSAYNNIKKCVEKAGIRVSEIVFEPIASAKAVLNKEEMEAGVAVIDIGGGTTDLTVIYDNIIRHTAVIPFGGSVITRDIKEGCIVMNDQAEKLKTTYGSALADKLIGNQIITIPGIRGRESKEVSQRNLAMIIQARMEEILDMVYFELTQSGYHNKLIAGVVITGGGSLLSGIRDLATFHLGMSAKVGEPVDKLGHGYHKHLADPKYATSIGLLIHAINKNEELPAPPVSEKRTEGAFADSTTSERQLIEKKPSIFNKLTTKFMDLVVPTVDEDEDL